MKWMFSFVILILKSFPNTPVSFLSCSLGNKNNNNNLSLNFVLNIKLKHFMRWKLFGQLKSAQIFHTRKQSGPGQQKEKERGSKRERKTVLQRLCLGSDEVYLPGLGSQSGTAPETTSGTWPSRRQTCRSNNNNVQQQQQQQQRRRRRRRTTKLANCVVSCKRRFFSSLFLSFRSQNQPKKRKKS